ncbi:sigma factor-like helix-turn-helix DNA-binding protein [Paenarthrobacter sp. 2TAF44]|uniref:sigma factor-like helix-turn-helix DNA-binding protein n=1 Tax=Paenarthrobacter sp. 2TAF44 TaxID=3233018 RepID=UPI003F9D30E8
MPSATDYQRLAIFLARRIGDMDYAQVLTTDTFRWAVSQAQAGIEIPFGALLAASARSAAIAIRDNDKAVAEQVSMAGIIAALHPVEREVLRLIYWDQLSMGELADYLGCSISHAGALLDRAYGHAEDRAKNLGFSMEDSAHETP